MQLAEGRFAFESPKAASMAYPELWPKAQAAKDAMRRSGELEGILLKIIPLLTECSLIQVRYRMKGVGQKTTICWTDLSDVSEIKAKLTALIGELAMFEIVREPTHLAADPVETKGAKVGAPPLFPQMEDLLEEDLALLHEFASLSERSRGELLAWIIDGTPLPQQNQNLASVLWD